MSLTQYKVPQSGKSKCAAKRLFPHLIFCLHDNKITETGRPCGTLGRPSQTNGKRATSICELDLAGCTLSFRCLDLALQGRMQGRARLCETHALQACARVTNLAEGASDGHDRGGTRLHGRLRGQGLPDAHGAPPPA